MENKIDIIMPSIQQCCRQGYLLPKEKQTLYDLAEMYGIDRSELDSALIQELQKVRKARLDDLYKAVNQPDAALSDTIKMFRESRRFFPDMVKVGSLNLKINNNVTAPAFIPLKNTTGLCIVYNGEFDIACNIIQNVVVRLLLSIPKSLAHVKIIDTASMGNDYIGLSGIDSSLITVIDDEKDLLQSLQTLNKEEATFNFNQLGNTFPDIAAYNRVHRGDAHPYQLIIISDFQNITDSNILAEIKKINKLASKTGVFFLFAVDAKKLNGNPRILDIFKTQTGRLYDICIIDMATHCIIADDSDEMVFVNKAYDLAIDTKLLFDAETILQLNHELNPNRYPLDAVNDRQLEYCIDALNLEIGKTTNKGKTPKHHRISIRQQHDNILVVSQNDEKIKVMLMNMIQSIVMTYKHSEINYVFYNCGFIPDTISARNIICNIHTCKMTYIHSILRHLEQETFKRQQLFQDANCADYESFRNSSNTMLPRIVCVLGGMETLLDSDSISAVETIPILDELLANAGVYGIHFILYGTPTTGMLKINLMEYVRFKMIGSITNEDAQKIGIFANDDDLQYQNLRNGCVIYENNQPSSTQLELSDISNDIWQKAISVFVPEQRPVYQKVYVDYTDTYPKCYKDVNVHTIDESCIKNNVPIGIPRSFDTHFSAIGSSNVIIAGNDPEGEQSIIKSVTEALHRAGNLERLKIYDVSSKNGHDYTYANTIHNLDSFSLEEGDILCLLHIDEIESQYVGKVYSLINEAYNKNIQVLAFVKNGISTNGLDIIASFFDTRIALCGAPEGFISVRLYTSDEVDIPKIPMQALCERIGNDGNMKVNAMWLFKYTER